MMQKDFIYSAGYYPLMHDESEWERDIKIMHESGIKMVRTAELFNTWDRIEPEKGKFNFGFLDRFFDLCAEYDIKILLGTGTAAPPYWLTKEYEGVNIVNCHGEEYPNNVSYTWACPDNPDFVRECERYIKILVNRYKDHPAMGYYQIHNEIGYPFMPLKEGEIDIYCYCEHTIAKFQIWLKDKYKTLDAVNYAYRWGATNTVHTTWEEIEPPKTKPSSWSSVTRWIDWRLFCMDSIVGFVKWQNDLIKEFDTVHPTTTNIFFLKSQDPMGVLTGLDQFEMAKVVDIIGYDLYPGSGDKLEKHPEFSSMFLDMSKSTTNYLNKDYWLLETESGPINGWMLGPSRNVKGFDLERNIAEAIAHDAKLTLYQVWRECEFQPLHWGGIVDIEGGETSRTKAAKGIGKLVNNYSKDIMSHKCKKGEVAILVSKENAIIVNGVGQEKFLMDCLKGAYRTFWEKNYTVDFITPDIMKETNLSDYKMIYMPFATTMSKDTTDILDNYVFDGGILIGTSRCGMVNEKGWYNTKIPAYTLANTFGVEAFDTYANIEPIITFKKKNYDGYWHKDEIIVTGENVEVIGSFLDDTPAVTVNHRGEGLAIFFGTHPDAGYLNKGSFLLWDVLEKICDQRGITPELDINYTNRKNKEIDAHLLQSKESKFIIITNYVNQKNTGFFNSKKKSVSLTLKSEEKISTITDIVSGEKVEFSHNDGDVTFKTDVYKNKVKILFLEGEA